MRHLMKFTPVHASSHDQKQQPMKQWIKLLIIISFIPLGLQAQDVHYSQFYTDYLRLNPSMAGNFDGTYRVGLNLRNQYGNVPAPYQTLCPPVTIKLHIKYNMV